jgi:lipopolysaccharide biosynthesis glycosyltransferase
MPRDFQKMTSSTLQTPVYVVAAANAKFNLPLCVMVASLVIHCDPARVLKIYVLSRDSGEKEKENVRQSIEMNRPGLKNVEVHWPAVDPAWFDKLPSNSRFGPDTFSRLFATYVLPPECEKYIYLDADMVVLSDICELHDTTLGSTTLHAARDVWSPWAESPNGVFNYRELGIPPKTRMFNAGMHVVNVKRWKERNVSARTIEYAVTHGTNAFFDQMALNACLHDDWTPVDQRWNQCYDVIYPQMWKDAGFTPEEWSRARDYPSVVHYTGEAKPWERGRWRPRYSIFFRYLNKTVHRNALPSQWFRLESLIGFRNHYKLWAIGRFLTRRVLKMQVFVPPQATESRS